MIKRKFLLVFVGICIFIMFGCRTVHHYGYKYVEIDMPSGFLAIKTIGNLGENYEESGKKFIDYSFPYYIQFTYVVDSRHHLSSVALSGLELIGKKNGRQYNLGDFASKDVRIYGDKKQVRFSVGPLSATEYVYQDFSLKAIVRVYTADGEFEEREIITELKTEYRKERRSDWFDEKMSV